MKTIRILLLLSGLQIYSAHAQVTQPLPDVSNIVNALDTLRSKAPLEKVHLHLDKPYYSIGDTIWLKAYVVHAENNSLSPISQMVYVDLINSRDSIARTLRIPLSSGLGWGDIPLADNFKEGSYRIRAYTSWMRSFGEEYFFSKQLTIGNALSGKVLAGVSYTAGSGAENNVMARIRFTDPSGRELSSRQVSYTISSKEGRLSRGKGTTDGNGELKISFNSAAAEAAITTITTLIQLDQGQTAQQDFLFRNGPVSVQFFPEGGQLVEGLESRIAFKALGSDGLGKAVSGTVSDDQGKQVASLSAEHAGMGSFSFTPGAGRTYTASIRFAQGGSSQVVLPKASAQGYILQAAADTSELAIRVSSSADLQSEVLLVAQSNGVVQYAARKKAGSGTFSARLPVTRFPEGILQLTLFAAGGEPLAERLVFIRHTRSRLKMTIKPDKESYQQRERVSLELQVTDQDGKPVVGSFSMAVTDEQKVPYKEDQETTIFSNLLLSSDLKGYIEQPNYYFTGNTTQKLQQLDNLMMTQGWRRFIWKDILAGKFPKVTQQAEQEPAISGRLLAPGSRKPVEGGRVTLLIDNHGGGFLIDTVTDAQGRFNFDNLIMSEGTTYNVIAKNARGIRDVLVEIDKPTDQPVMVMDRPVAQDTTGLSTYLNSSRNRFAQILKQGASDDMGIVLQDVTITATKNSSSLAGAGNADQVLTFADMKDCGGNLAQCLALRLVGVRFSKDGATGNMNAYTRAGIASSDPMLVIVDGVERSEGLSTLFTQEVASVEVLRGGGAAALYGMKGANGVIIITSRRGDTDYQAYTNAAYDNSGPSKGLSKHIFQGYAPRREFYSPEYDRPQPEKTSDLRTTVYWDPSVITDENGKVTVNFYNADGTGNYRIIAEGLNADGNLGRVIHRYNVKRK